ncbi:AaceriAFR633Wp [[Ashbya] aceris (nom. inval.)]|nr:AaceriAFR633Wp [[Ashbya] aceris (nom. inval.)]
MSFRLPYFGFFDAVNAERATVNAYLDVPKSGSVAAHPGYKQLCAHSDIVPSLVILERIDAYELHLKVPSVLSPERIDIALHRDIGAAVVSIVVPGTYTDENTDCWGHGEPRTSEFRRTVRLPTKVGTCLGQVTATYDDEVLTLKLQKLEASANTTVVHRIRIEASSRTR